MISSRSSLVAMAVMVWTVTATTLTTAVSAAAAAGSSSVANINCESLPIWKETTGSDNYPYMDAMVQITSQDVDAVTFSVQQLWNQDGVPMVAVHYRDLTQGGGEDVCNMNAPNQGTNLVQYQDAEEFTAQCTHGYADVGVYVYVGPSDDFNVEECEACTAPDQNYVGYYLTLNCEPCDEPEQPKPFDCVELSTPITKEIIGNTNNTIDMGGVADVPPVTITAQNVDTVTVTVAQVFNPEGLPMMAVGYRAPESNELQCEMETSNVAFNFQLEITAQCTLGYAEIVLYLYVGDEQDFDVEDCEACTVPNEEQYAAIYYVVPCTPVCKPEVPDCLEGPLVTLADIEHETAVCLYESTPVTINTQALTTDRVEFTIDNTWPTGSDISSLSVSYQDERSGELQCTRFEYDAANTFRTSKTIVAVCDEGMASVVVEIHSAKIGYHAEQITPNACAAASSTSSNNSEIGTCAYEFIVPCGPILECGTTLSPTAAPTDLPTSFPTFHPTAFPSVVPTESPSERPSSNPSTGPSNVPSETSSEAPSGSYFPSSAPSDGPTVSKNPSASPSSSPSENPTETPTIAPSTSPSNPPSSKPSTSPSSSPSITPSGSPSTSPSGSPSSTPSNSPTSGPTSQPSSSPSTKPTSSPSSAPSASPTSNPTASMNPTDCYAPAKPKVTQSICMQNNGEGNKLMDTPITFPDTAFSIFENDKTNTDRIDFTVTQHWNDQAGMAIRPSVLDDCVVEGDMGWNNSTDIITSECYEGFTSVTVVVYLDTDEFDVDECDACNIDDLALMDDGLNSFCAYIIEIPCEPVPVECGEPSTAPSGSYFPSSAPSDSPTESAVPSDGPTLTPSTTPSNGPSLDPSSKPSDVPSDGPSLDPSSKPSDVPSDGPSLDPSSKPSDVPSSDPSESPSSDPSGSPSSAPSSAPSESPSDFPSTSPSESPSGSFYPSSAPSDTPTESMYPSTSPSSDPTKGPTNEPTTPPTVAEAQTQGPTPCPPSDPILVANDGETMYPDLPITITRQNTTHVAFQVENTFDSTASSVFTQYHTPGPFAETECLEEENVDGNSVVGIDFVARCMHNTKISIVNIWVTDCDHDDKDAARAAASYPPFFLDQVDNAEVPECCHPSEKQCRTVQYTFKLPCVSPCPDDTVPISTMSPTVAPVASNPVAPPVNGGQFGRPDENSTGNDADTDTDPISTTASPTATPVSTSTTTTPVDSPVDGDQFGRPNEYSSAENGADEERRTLAAAVTTMNDEGSPHEFETLTGQVEPNADTNENEEPFCVVDDYPCGAPNYDKVHVCHYSARDGYKTFCVPEPDSDALRFYPKDYCGPCVAYVS